jgi:putative sugar O-methyltransferase
MMHNKALQVADDPALLTKMLEDQDRCNNLYKPTNYWAYYEKKFVPELRQHGLKDFRRRRASVLNSFGATDLKIKAQIEFQPRIRGRSKLTKYLNVLFNKLPFVALTASEINLDDVTLYFYWRVKAKFDALEMDLDKCPTSRFGNPEDLLEVNGGLWSREHLQYCSMFAEAANHISFHERSTICELGPGMGRNIEVMAHLLPGATFLAFDIAPQLYVSNSYLQAVFGSRVIPYRDAVSLKPESMQEKGKIIILPSWKMPQWSSFKIDVFWNSASFQEMEPDVVLNYLRLVNQMRPESIYIHAMPEGNYWGEWKRGRGGTKTPVDEKYYFESLKDSYSLAHSYSTDLFLQKPDHQSYIFKRRGH